MSVIYTLEYKKSKKRAAELKAFLLELDLICDKLYNKLEFTGVWEALNRLEDVRIQYYTEFYEHDKIVSLKGRIDDKNWLTFGTIDTLPLLYADFPILMAGSGSKAVIRVGELTKNTNQDKYKTINWSDIPAGNDLNVRMSGLVWPEASARIANSAYLTQEKYGKGQIILFSGEPNFRGSSLGTNRVWLNAVVYGSGMGTSARITP